MSNYTRDDLARDLLRELGETAEPDDLISNHRDQDWDAAAAGDVAALVRIRTACGLAVVV